MTGPRWDDLYEVAASQAGHFTTAQAADAGYSPPLLDKYLANGRVTRIRRGVYRLVHFPSGDDEDLVVLWLWSGCQGVFSHETALSRHQLSDLLPRDIEMTVPAAWARRRLKIPEGLRLHHADLSETERTWHGPVPITTPYRTILDYADVGVSLEFVHQATEDAIRLGLLSVGRGIGQPGDHHHDQPDNLNRLPGLRHELGPQRRVPRDRRPSPAGMGERAATP